VTRRMRGRVVVHQQSDGWWRWRFEPSSGGRALVSGEAYPERDEAVESAQEAYPTLYPLVESPTAPRHRLRGVVRRAATAAVVAGVVVVAARSGNRSRTASGS